MNRPHIRVIGDSFVEGVGSQQGGWVKRFVDCCSALDIVVDGKGGRTTNDIVELMASTEWSKKSAAVIFEVGINDSRFRPSLLRNEVAIDNFVKNISRIVSVTKELGASHIAFLSITEVNESRTKPFKADKFYRNQDIYNYNHALESLSKAIRFDYIKLPSMVENTADGLHVNDRGHQAICEQVSQWLSEAGFVCN